MEHPLFQLLYFSRASGETTQPILPEILEQARRNNPRLGLSGMLIYEDHHFMQVLEGPEQSVNEIFETIRADDRHTDVFTIYSYPIAERQFDGWAMAHFEFQPGDKELRSSFIEIEKCASQGIDSISEKARKFVTTFEKLLKSR